MARMLAGRTQVYAISFDDLHGRRHPDKTNGSRLTSHFGITKPSLIIKTESNVMKIIKKRPDPPCVKCSGSGSVDCRHCHGKGRTNYVDLTMLPKGEWPRWCRACGGSGLEFCSRCIGTGEYRDIMGFRFMKMSNN